MTRNASALRTELLKRLAEAQKRNPRYSVRSFARALKIDHSALSRILSGKRKIGEKLEQQLWLRLGISADPKVPPAPDDVYVELDPEKYLLFRKWFIGLIPLLLLLPGFKLTAQSISEALDLPLNEAKHALQFLIDSGALVLNPRTGRYQDAFPALSLKAFKNHPGVKPLDDEAIHVLSQRAIQAYLTEPDEEVSNSYLYFAGDPKKLAQARKLINQCRRDVAQLMESTGRDPSRVYILKIDLFPIVKAKTKSRTSPLRKNSSRG